MTATAARSSASRSARVLAKAELIQRTGSTLNAVPLTTVQALIAARLGR